MLEIIQSLAVLCLDCSKHQKMTLRSCSSTPRVRKLVFTNQGSRKNPFGTQHQHRKSLLSLLKNEQFIQIFQGRASEYTGHRFKLATWIRSEQLKQENLRIENLVQWCMNQICRKNKRCQFLPEKSARKGFGDNLSLVVAACRDLVQETVWQ